MKLMFLISLAIILLCCSYSFSQELGQQVQIEKMDISWKFENDRITFTATAPDDGWVALGFNTENNIVGSNLIMTSVNGSKVNIEDFYVVSAGNPKPVVSLGSKSQIINNSGFESERTTTVTFSLPIAAFDIYHKNLKKGNKIWLIGAYSMEDEFDHHSRMRKHVEITL